MFRIFLRLGLTSFGGPIAHLGYFNNELVQRRRWLTSEQYAQVVALCQTLPGPASSQVGIALGLMRAGLLGSLAAWVAFTLPSAIIMVLFAYGVSEIDSLSSSGWLDGFKIVAVAVVAHAVWSLARTLAADRSRIALALGITVFMLLWSSALAQVIAIALGALVGWRLISSDQSRGETTLPISIGRGFARMSLVLFLALLLVTAALARLTDSQPIEMVEVYYRAGAIVFGSGHVVLPVLQTAVVPAGWVTNEEFLSGYGMAQAVPGPLFTITAYLGAVQRGEPAGIGGAAVALVAIYVPSFLLLYGALPLWRSMQRRAGFLSAVKGVNAAVVGILGAALIDPVGTSAIDSPVDAAVAAVAFALIAFARVPAWVIVLAVAVAGGMHTALG